MEDEGDYFVFRSPVRYDYQSKICLAMRVDTATTPEEKFHVVVERCRCVLFTCYDHVLVSPQPEHFLLICDPAFPDTNLFKQIVRRISLVETWSCPVTSEVLSECLSFSLAAKLGPDWNKVGEWLLQGSRFLHQAEPLNAVKMRLNVANGRVEVSVMATRVSFPLISPEDLGVGPDLLEKFIRGDENVVLTEKHFGQQTLHVLPRLNRARLISISKKIPPCPEARLSNWDAMKTCWKNLHGFQLGVEESDQPNVYYNVNFWNGLTFTYPEWTVRLANPRPIPETDPQPILDNFIKDLLAYNKVVFGLQFSLEPVEPLVPGVTPSYSQEQPPAPTVTSRKEQQEPEIHFSRPAAVGFSSLANLTKDHWRRAETPVELEVRTEARARAQDSGRPRTAATIALPMTANRMKPSFMMNTAAKDQKNQLKASRPFTRFTRKIIENYNPFPFENDPEVKAAIARASAKKASQWEQSQKLLMELCTKKEEKTQEEKEKERSSRMLEEFMSF